MPKPTLHETNFGGGVDALFSSIQQETPFSQMLEISSIYLPPKQPRRYFDKEALATLSKSIAKNGVLQPLVVRPLDNGFYELVAGERRFRASKLADLIEVPCIVKELTSDEAYEIALVENLQREDLNPVDETEGILELIERLLQKPREEIISLFHLAKHTERSSGNNVIPTEEWQTIEQVFDRISKITPTSFANNRLPLLNMPKEVLEAVRDGKIEYTKAKVIGRIKELEAREALLAEAISSKLSLTDIKQKAKASVVKKPGQRQSKASVAKVLKNMDSLYKKARKSELWGQPENRKRLEKILSELEELMNDAS